MKHNPKCSMYLLHSAFRKQKSIFLPKSYFFSKKVFNMKNNPKYQGVAGKRGQGELRKHRIVKMKEKEKIVRGGGSHCIYEAKIEREEQLEAKRELFVNRKYDKN